VIVYFSTLSPSQGHELIISGRPSSKRSEILQVPTDHRGIFNRNGSFRMSPLLIQSLDLVKIPADIQNFLLACLFRHGGIAILLSSLCNLFLMTYAGYVPPSSSSRTCSSFTPEISPRERERYRETEGKKD
jgi:hypothetical protein